MCEASRKKKGNHPVDGTVEAVDCHRQGASKGRFGTRLHQPVVIGLYGQDARQDGTPER